MSKTRRNSKSVKKEENYFYQKFKKKIDEYKIINGEIILDNNYKITLNQGGDILEIMRVGKKKDYPRYKIIRNEDKIYIYNDKYYGKKIVQNGDKLTLYHNDKLMYEFKNVQ